MTAPEEYLRSIIISAAKMQDRLDAGACPADIQEQAAERLRQLDIELDEVNTLMSQPWHSDSE